MGPSVESSGKVGEAVAGAAAPATVRTATFAGFAAGLRLGPARLFRRPLLWIGLLGAAVALALSVIERGAMPHGALDRTLEAVFRWVVPLISFAVVGLATGPRRLGESVWCTARFGLSRRQLAVGLLLTAMLAAVLLALVAVELCVATAGSSALGLSGELWTSGWIAALGGGCYVAFFGAGAAFLRFGRGRWVLLGADFVLGEGSGAWSIPWPRAHLRNLIGGEPVAELPQYASSFALLAVGLVLLVVAGWRCGR